ncbi:MAG: hypothetical protein K2G16_00955 [Lachnospiraceae bacterium]|nr:hypothetical protein [Lachnospiraceae bacterium]
MEHVSSEKHQEQHNFKRKAMEGMELDYFFAVLENMAAYFTARTTLISFLQSHSCVQQGLLFLSVYRKTQRT